MEFVILTGVIIFIWGIYYHYKKSTSIHIDSNGTAESDTYTIKNNLPIDFEIKYEVYCISRDIWVTAPPRIIIGHVVN